MKKTALCSIALLSLSACASIVDGRHQDITVNTNPSGADCTLNRKGETIAQISPTPATTNIEKTKDDITIVCVKPGYVQSTYLNHSGVDMFTFGNIAIGGLIGWGIDSSLGADNKYDSPVNITLNPATVQVVPGTMPPSSGMMPPSGAMAPSAAPSAGSPGAPTAMQPLAPVPSPAQQR